ncbi:aminoglycoside phosphotransferase family protein [Chloroflexota bacterium]
MEVVNRDIVVEALKNKFSGMNFILKNWTLQNMERPGLGDDTSDSYKITGNSQINDSTIKWSMYVKHSRTGVGEFGRKGAYREFLVYSTGLINDLSLGLYAPKCFLARRQKNGHLLLILEDLGGENSKWAIREYRTAAKKLGQFNGYFHSELPSKRWLSHRWLENWVSGTSKYINLLIESNSVSQLQRWLTISECAEIVQVWKNRKLLFEQLRRLPSVFCHMDAWKRNLLFSNVEHDKLYAFDWGYAGIGSVGEDLGPLIWSSYMLGEISQENMEEVEHTLIMDYCDGVQQYSNAITNDQIYEGYNLSSSLRYIFGGVRTLFRLIDDLEWRERLTLSTATNWDEISELYANMVRNRLYRVQKRTMNK